MSVDFGRLPGYHHPKKRQIATEVDTPNQTAWTGAWQVVKACKPGIYPISHNIVNASEPKSLDDL